jgi:hypothetical protein
MRARPILTTSTVAAMLATAGLAAQAAPTIKVDPIACMRTGDNQVVHAATVGEPGGGSGRLYFRWMDHGDQYWVPLENDGPGHYWATPPKPESRTNMVEYYGVLLNDAGAEVARSPVLTAKVTGDCRVQLNARQQGSAANLVIGETSPKQAHNKVMGFLCDGIVTRVNPENVKRGDETCRTCVVAWWARPDILVPLVGAVAGGATTIIVDHPESSPSRP